MSTSIYNRILEKNLSPLSKYVLLILAVNSNINGECSLSIDELRKLSNMGVDFDPVFTKLLTNTLIKVTKENKYSLELFVEKFKVTKKDFVDAHLDLLEMPALKKQQVAIEIRNFLKERLKTHLVYSTAKELTDFVEFLCNRQVKDKFNTGKFFTWFMLRKFNEENKYTIPQLRELWDEYKDEIIPKQDNAKAIDMIMNIGGSD